MAEASQLALDAGHFIAQLSPLFLVIGGVSFADLTITYLIKLVKKTKGTFE